MTATVADKIFVEPNEEISFLVQRIVNSEKEHLIIVVPSASVLFASALSIKILYRSIVKVSKTAIIVTEDDYGTKISQKVGFVVVSKVSQITSDLWEIAKGKLYSAQNSLNNKKDSLLKNIKGENPIEGEVQGEEEGKSELMQEYSDSVAEIVEDNTTEVFEINDLDDKGDIEEEEPEIFKQEKVKEISGIKIFSGSDIENLKKRETNDKIVKLDNLDNMENSKEDLSVFSEKRFAGRDVTKMTPESPGIFSGILKIFGGKKVLRPEDRIDDSAEPIKWYKRKSVIIGSGIFIAVLFVAYLALFQFSTVSIDITLKSQNIVAEETVEIDVEGKIEEVDLDKMIIPGEKLEGDEVNQSFTAVATGEGKRGEKATGAVYIFNKQKEDIEIPAGTNITSISTGLVYEVVEDTTLPAATEASDLSINPSRTDNVRVIAVSFGEEYNIEDSGSDSGFSIEGLTGFSSQDIKREGSFTGGTLEEFVSVSEEDIDKVKKEYLDDLENEAFAKLNSDVPKGYIFIEETLEFDEVEIKSNPAVGEEAELNPDGENVFNVTLVLKANGIIIRESDIKEVVTEALINSEDSEGNDLNDLSDVGFKDFLENSAGVFITVFAEGNVVKSIDEEAIFESIKGMKINPALEKIRENEDLQSVEIKYFPSVIPDSMQFIPRSIDRVNFNLR